MSDLYDRWPPLLAERASLRDQLLAAYAEPHRGYHDQRHLREVLDRLEELYRAQDSTPEDSVVLAAWFHDAVYDDEGDNEQRSARLAEQELTGLPATVVDEVARLVRLTSTHDPADDDLRGQLLCDADLAILAADQPRYDDYARGVRAEYSRFTDTDFAAGRSVVLQALLSAPSLFRTAHGRAAWEARARVNVAAELERLSGSVSNPTMSSPPQPGLPGERRTSAPPTT